MFTPIKEGYGTRIKILEALAYRNRILTTKKGIEGIDYDTNKNIQIVYNKNDMIRRILKFSKQKKISSNNFIKKYSMKANSKKLFNYINS